MNVILDTNVLVAAGFNPKSSSARIIKAVEKGTIHLVWNQATKRETQTKLEQIPRLSWEQFAGLFTPEREYTGPVESNAFQYIEDPDDRKFAVLAEATKSVLVTNDTHLLSQREKTAAPIMTPWEFTQEYTDFVPTFRVNVQAET